MCNIGDEETVGIGFVRGDTGGTSSSSGVCGCVVNAEEDAAVDETGETACVGCYCRRIGDEAMSWVGRGKEVEVSEEVALVIGVGDGVGCCACETRCTDGGSAEARKNAVGTHFGR